MMIYKISGVYGFNNVHSFLSTYKHRAFQALRSGNLSASGCEQGEVFYQNGIEVRVFSANNSKVKGTYIHVSGSDQNACNETAAAIVRGINSQCEPVYSNSNSYDFIASTAQKL